MGSYSRWAAWRNTRPRQWRRDNVPPFDVRQCRDRSPATTARATGCSGQESVVIDSGVDGGSFMAGPPAIDRQRVSAAVLRHAGQEALMVQYRRGDGTAYWQLPGGGIEASERPKDA